MPERLNTDNDVKLAMINQFSNVLKWVIAAALLAWFAWLAKTAAIEMSDDAYKPAWERVTTQIITAIVALVAPSGLFYALLKWGIPVIRRRLSRISELERSIDPERTSSEHSENKEGSRSPAATPLETPSDESRV